jgi:DNA-binding LacI/PurR family transcriptional regulator
MVFVPEYRKIKENIEGMIDRGILRRGGLVPGERDLARQLGTTLAVVRRAVNKLAEEGTVIRMPRKGTVVSDRAAASRVEQTWSVVIPSMEYFYPPIVHVIEEEARTGGATVTLHCIGSSISLEQTTVRQVVEKGATGILLAPAVNKLGQARARESLEYLTQLPVPVVLMDHLGVDLPMTGLDCVLADNFAGTYLATTHLIRHNYTRIAMFGDMTPNLAPEFLQRTRGYQAALADHGLSGPESLILNAWNIDNRPDLVKEYLDKGVRAFVCGDDTTAHLAVMLFERLGYPVPGRAAVIGFDNEPFCPYTHPPLTSVGVDKKDMAVRAVKLLQDRIERGTRGEYRSIVLRPTLYARQSCGQNCPAAPSLSQGNELQGARS